MDDWQLPWGRVLVRRDMASGKCPPLLTMAYHCTECQKLSASVYSLRIAGQVMVCNSRGLNERLA
jgi:hypothetical protein